MNSIGTTVVRPADPLMSMRKTRLTKLCKALIIAGLAGTSSPVLSQETGKSTLKTLSGDTVSLIDPSQIDLISISDFSTGTQQLSVEGFDSTRAIDDITSGRTGNQNRVILSLGQARMLALENNLNLQSLSIGPAIAQETLNEEAARFDSIFSASATLRSQETPSAAAPDGSVRTNGYDANIQLDVPLRTGGRFTVALPTRFNNPGIPNADSVQDTTLQLSISQPLLRNAGRPVAEAPIEIAKVRSNQEQARAKLSAIQTLADTENAYWALYAASSILDIRVQQYERALDLERKARRLAEVQVVPKIEVIRAVSGVSRRLDAILLAETQRIEAERALKVLLNDVSLALSDSTFIELDSDPDPILFEPDKPKAVELALENRLDLIDLQLQLAADELAIIVASNQTKPGLDLNASASLAGRDTSLGGSIGADFTSAQIGLQFNLPFGNRAALAREARSKLLADQTKASFGILERNINQQVLNSLDRLRISWQRIVAAKREAELAAETFEAEQRQFLSGTRTSTDVLEAADFLAEAQVREITTLATYEQDKVNAALATGTLLGKGQVSLSN